MKGRHTAGQTVHTPVMQVLPLADAFHSKRCAVHSEETLTLGVKCFSQQHNGGSTLIFGNMWITPALHIVFTIIIRKECGYVVCVYFP